MNSRFLIKMIAVYFVLVGESWAPPGGGPGGGGSDPDPEVTAFTVSTSSVGAGSSVTWTITFSEAVTGVDATDFELIDDSFYNASIISVLPASSTPSATWDIQVYSGIGNGDLRLDFDDDGSVVDSADQDIQGNGDETGPVVAVSMACSTESFADKVVINEIYIKAGDDFVELYYKDSAVVDSSVFDLCYIDPNGDPVCEGWQKSAEDYYPWEIDETVELNPSKGEVYLLDQYANVIDAWLYCGNNCDLAWFDGSESCATAIDHGAARKDMHRSPDGTGTPADKGSNASDSTPTRGYSNDSTGGGNTALSGFACQHAGDGSLYTRVAGSSFGYELQASFSEGSAISGDVTVALIDASGGTGCGGAVIASDTVTFSDQSTLLVSDADAEAFTVNSVYQSVECRVTYDSVSYCSSDTFSIRPAAFILSEPLLNNAGSSGTPVAAAGDNFTLGLTTTAGYAGTVTIDEALLQDHNLSTPASGSLSGSFASIDAGAGTVSGTFLYGEVGNFRFLENAILDSTYTSGDQSDGDCIAGSYSNVPVGGKVGCLIGSDETDWIGRFTPHHFEMTTTAGSLENSCNTGGFSYAGTAIGYGADPVLLITAKNGIDAGGGNFGTTVNYRGDYDKRGADIDFLSIPTVSVDNSTLGHDGTNYVQLSADAGSASLASNNNGTFTLTLTAGAITYSTGGNNLAAPFQPDPGLSLEVTDSDGISGTADIAIDMTGIEVRYGRLALNNASGAETSNLTVTMETQYYDGLVNGYVTNTDDSCTTLATSTISISDPDAGDSLLNTDTCVLIGASCTSGSDELAASSGAMSFDLQAPGSGKAGDLTISVDVPAYLEFEWSGASAEDPASTVTFGSAPREQSLIFMRDVR